jgi:aspartate aminotransferase
MISARAKGIKPSPTLAIDAKVKALQAGGADVVNLGVGEPDFDTPAHVKEAAIQAIREGFTKYTPAAGIPALRDAVAEKFRRDSGLAYEREQVVVSCGAKHSLYNIAQAILDPGDEVIIPAPYWVSYPDQVILNEAKPVILSTEESDGFALRPEALEARITPRTRALILNSPSNPTGCSTPRPVLEQIAEVALRHSLWVISDEIYEKIVYDGARHVSIASLGEEIKARTFVVNGLSKSHCMTGWRIGFAAGPKSVMKAVANIQSQSTSNPNSIAQKAALAALTGPQDFLAAILREFDARRLFLLEELNAMPGLSCRRPDGAFYTFPNASRLYGKASGSLRIRGSSDLALYLLDEAKVAVVPGEAFGADAHIRLSYATSMDNLKKAAGRMREALAKLA